MRKDSIRNIVVIFQTTILRIVGFYVRRSAIVNLAMFIIYLLVMSRYRINYDYDSKNKIQCPSFQG